MEHIKRNYFIIGSVLTFLVIGGTTIYAKVGIEKHSQIDAENISQNITRVSSSTITRNLSDDKGGLRRHINDNDGDENEGDDDYDGDGYTNVQTDSVSSTGTSSMPSIVAKTLTLQDIATHNSQTSCYTTIGGNVYDLTSYIDMHKGGDKILAVCGKDGNALFEAQHGGKSKPANALARLKIGTLAQ